MEKKTARAKKSSSPKGTSRHKSTASVVKDQTAYLAGLIEHVSDALISTDSQSNVLSWNAAAEAIYGWKAKEVIGHPVDGFLKTDYLGKTNEQTAIKQVFEDGYWQGEVIQSRKDGSDFLVLSSVSTIKNDGGQMIGLVAINRDITERKQVEETLRESRGLLQTIIDHFPGLISAKDLNGNVIMVNRNFEVLEGPHPEEYIGKNVHELFPKEVADVLWENDLAAQHAGRALESEETVLHKDGSWHVYQTTKLPLYKDEKMFATCAISFDISERKQVEEALKRSEREYRHLFDNANDVIFIFEPEQEIILEANAKACAIYGFEREELIGMSLKNLTKDVAKGESQIRSMLESGSYRDFESVHINKDGMEIYFLINSSVIEYRGRKAILSINHDITERNRAEQELRDSEERFRELADNIEEVFWITEPESKKEVYISPAYEKVWGRSLKNVDDFVESVLSEDRPLVVAALEKQKHGEKTEIEYRIQHTDGSMRWIWDRALPIFDKTGELIRMVGIAADVTERKRSEETIQKYAAELEQRVEQRTADLTRANRTKDEFLANMSHELRTPLNGILGFSEALLDGVRGPLTEKQKQAIETILSSGHHLLGLINDVLDVTKIEAGKLDFHPEILDATEICQASLVFVKEMAEKKSVILEFEPLRPPSSFLGDPQRMKQILVNLLSNSIKFTPENGKVILDVRSDAAKNQIHFRVADTGIGIAPEDLERLFNPFVQMDSSLTREHAGSGLGLALAYKLVEMHGGNISVESEVGKGSSFTVALPWNQKTDARQEKNPASTGSLNDNQQGKNTKTTPAAELSPGERGTILLAEDKETNVMVIKDYLEYRGYQVITAGNGVEALSKAEELSPDAILMDIQMPEMDGLEAIRRLRSNPRFSTTPIIAITAFAMPGDRERCIAAGANEYLSKPISLKALKQR